MPARLLSVKRALSSYFIEHVEPNVVAVARQQAAIRHLTTYFGKLPLLEVDIPKCRAYAAARFDGRITVGKGRGKRNCESQSTIRRELAVLIAAANHALRWKRLARADFPIIDLPRETPRRRPRILTKENINEALSVCQSIINERGEAEIVARQQLANARGAKIEAAQRGLAKAILYKEVARQVPSFILIAYYTGARRRAVTHLKKSQVDLKYGRIDFSREDIRITKKRRPVVPIFPEIRSIVEKLMNESATEYLFETPRDLYRPFVRVMSAIGVKAWPHLLRHSRASHMLMDGEDPYKVAKLLGDTLRTVEEVYGHYAVDYLHTKSSLDT